MAAAREPASWRAHPALAGRRVVLYAPTFRGRGVGKRAARGLDAARLRAALPDGPRARPQDPPEPRPGRDRRRPAYDVVADPAGEINDLLRARPTSSSPTTRRRSSSSPCSAGRSSCSSPTWPTYERDPGLYLDYRTEMIGTQVDDTDGVIEAIATGAVRPVRLRRVHRAAARAPRGGASDRVRRALPRRRRARQRRGDTLPPRCPPPVKSPAAFRQRRRRPGPFALIREAHRGHPLPTAARPLPRPGRHPQARRGHAPRQPLVGPRPAPPDGRLRRLRDDRRPRHDPRLPALHLRGDPALEVVHRVDHRRDGVDRQRRTGSSSRSSSPRSCCRSRRRRPASSASRSGSSRSALLMLFYPDRISPYLAAHPGDRRGPVRVHAGVRAPRRGRQRLLPRPRQRRVARPAAVVVPVARAVQPRGRSTSCTSSRSTRSSRRSPRRTRSRSCSRPTGRSSTGRRRRRPACRTSGSLASLLVGEHHASWRSRRSIFKRLEPNFAKVL